VAACLGGWLVVHFIDRKNAPFPLFHITGDATERAEQLAFRQEERDQSAR
jgi:hypothetical protein